MNEALGDLPPQLPGIGDRQGTVLDHLAHILPRDVFEYDVGRSVFSREDIRIDDLHHARVDRQTQQRSVFLLQSVEFRVLVVQDQLHDPADIPKRVDHPVGNPEAARFPQPFLNHILRGQDITGRQVAVIGLRGAGCL